MRSISFVLLRVLWGFFFLASSLLAQQPTELPTNPKAQKTYQEALDLARKRQTRFALDDFKKADKQDDGHCLDCKKKIIQLAVQLRDWKAANTAADELIAASQDPKHVALAHYHAGIVALYQGLDKHNDEYYTNAHNHFAKALDVAPNFPDAIFGDGKALAYLHQDAASQARFQQYVKMSGSHELDRQRAQRYLTDPELVRARMAPAFAVTTSDGQHLALDDLTGKVVLIDFWATWCGPCRAALPHIRDITRKFKDEPLVVLSVSLDDDEKKWKDFVTQNEMTWPQYHDRSGFRGEMADLFSVHAIPHTFTIDADGVLQDEQIGDASIEGKLKKLIARAKEVQAAAKAGQ